MSPNQNTFHCHELHKEPPVRFELTTYALRKHRSAD